MRAKWRLFVDEYFKLNLNATRAYRAVFSTNNDNTAAVESSRLLRKPNVKAEIERRLKESQMEADEVLYSLTQQARGDLGEFFKLVEEWTFYPLPSYDIIDVKEVNDDTDPDNPVKRVSYWVRHIALDMDKVIDPRYSHLLHKFSDSPKNGLGIEIYNKQTALQTLAKYHGLLVDRTDITSGGEKLSVPDERYDRAVSTFADVIRESLSGAVQQPQSPVDAPEQPTVASPTEPGG